MSNYGSRFCSTRNIGSININEANKIYIEFLNLFIDKTKQSKTKIVIEPLSKNETDFINNTEEAYKIINEIQSDRLGLHIDLKSAFAENENLEKTFKNTTLKLVMCMFLIQI